MPQRDNKSIQFLARYGYIPVGAISAGASVYQEIDTINWDFPNGIVFIPRFYWQGDVVTNGYGKVKIKDIYESDTNDWVSIDAARLIGSYDETQNNARIGNLISGVPSLKNGLGVIGKFKRNIYIELSILVNIPTSGAQLGIDLIFSPNYFPIDMLEEYSKL